MKKDSLGDRMKGYEGVNRNFLMTRTPAIIRIDGKAFHTFTKGFDRPFDDILIGSMQETAEYLARNIQGCKLAYVQSDEISLLLTDYEKLTTDAWFSNNIQKMVSVSASMATMKFNKVFREKAKDYQRSEYKLEKSNYKKIAIYLNKMGIAMFDSRAFNLPKEEVCNYFIWRQQDATRNSIQMLAQSEFSHKELQGLSCNKLQDKLMVEKGINFNDIEVVKKRGTCIKKGFIDFDIEDWRIDEDIPIFTQDRNYIEELL